MTTKKTCIGCKNEKPLTEFYFQNAAKGTRQSYCKPCQNVLTGKYARDRAEESAKAKLSSNLILRLKVLSLYGGKCACCGEENYKLLTIDHIHSDGYLERGKNRTANGIGKWTAMLKTYAPDRFQVLCYNCNCGRAYNSLNKGVCPHEEAFVDLNIFLTALEKERAVRVKVNLSSNGGHLGSGRKKLDSCGHGHSMSGDNLYVSPNTGRRSCRACKARKARERRQKSKS